MPENSWAQRDQQYMYIYINVYIYLYTYTARHQPHLIEARGVGEPLLRDVEQHVLEVKRRVLLFEPGIVKLRFHMRFQN